MNVQEIVYYMSLFLVLIGGINWLVTGVRSLMNESDPQVDDLLELIKLPQEVSNIIYIVVFVATLIVMVPFLKRMA